MMSVRALSIAAAAIVLAQEGCVRVEPEAQVVFWFDTDAILPARPGATVEGPMFDSLRIEVYEPGRSVPCTDCARTFSLDTERFAKHELSFGVRIPPDVGGYRIRARMYPSFATLTGRPAEYDDGPAMSVVEIVARLPAIARGQILFRHAFLATDSVGSPRGTLEQPIEASEGPVTESLVGTWPGAKTTPCVGARRASEVCIEGGAFWMGNARVVDTGFGDGADRVRLVVVSPFWLDANEVTVGAYRAFTDKDVTLWTGNSEGNVDQDFCTFTTSSIHDSLPVNCVTYGGAKNYCAGHGKANLPTEAQFEFVAGGRKNRLFVWGSADPTCDNAVLMRGGWGVFDQFAQECKTAEPPGSPLAIANRPAGFIDRLVTADGPVSDLAGNLTEFMADSWNRQTEPCWSAEGVFVDPICTTPSTVDTKLPVSIKGASFVDSPRLGAAAMRSGKDRFDSLRVGFRCARPAIE